MIDLMIKNETNLTFEEEIKNIESQNKMYGSKMQDSLGNSPSPAPSEVQSSTDRAHFM